MQVVLGPLSRRTRGATMLSPDGGEWWVVLNANDRYPVRRFTLAQEASHIACGRGLAMRREGCGEFYECSLADHFSGHLLIRSWLQRLATAPPPGIAAACRVSRVAARTELVMR